MSFYRTYTPPEDVIKKMEEKGRNSRLSSIDDTKIELRTYCMLEHDPNEVCNAIMHIKFLLGSMKYDIEKSCYRYAVERYNEDDKHTVWFCGWKYANDEPDSDEESVFKYVVENLINLTFVVKTPDWFEESEKFHEKLSEIDSMIEYFEDAMSEVYDFQVMKELKEYEEKDDDEEDSEPEPESKPEFGIEDE